MIIGKNTNLHQKNNFINSNVMNPNTSQKNTIQQNPTGMKPLTNNTQTAQHLDIMNKHEMREKSFSMLQERLKKGQISLEEFNKKCSKLRNMK